MALVAFDCAGLGWLVLSCVGSMLFRVRLAHFGLDLVELDWVMLVYVSMSVFGSML